MATWHTVESARDEWSDAPVDEDDGDSQLADLLAGAKLAVRAYAPSLPDDGGAVIDEDGYIVSTEDVTQIPETYRMAQLMQARNIWNSTKASPQGVYDNGEYGLSNFPLDWQIRQLLRPKKGRPVIA